MNLRNSEEKRLIVKKLINSGINITPPMLDLFLKLDNPLEKVSIIIKEISFIPTFNSHITIKTLQQIQNEEIKKVLLRNWIKPVNLSTTDDNSERYEEKEKKKKKKIKEAKIISPPDIIKEPLKKEASIIPKKNFSYNSPKTTITPFNNDKAKKVKIKTSGSTKSAFKFKLIAKEYDPEWEVLKDPTGKLYTNGEYDDFYDLTIDKFNQLYKLMKNKSETLSASKINNIIRNSQNIEVATIGIVNEIRQTKRGNYLILLEDMTGTINVLLRKNSEDLESVRLAERTINDQMIFVEGAYSPGDKGKKGIIFANYISKIEFPKDFQPSKSLDPLSIALISDTHIGSKEFEEKLWNRFINFLNGKIGNKNIKEISGKIKYIIINGDLIDGIGIYPNQQEDLIINDLYKQYNKAAELLAQIPEHIKIFYSSGNHEPVRNAIPRPAVPKKYIEDLMNIDVKCLGNPATIKTHNVNTLIYHGDSILDMNMLIAGLDHDRPVDTMKELLKCRHLAPVYGKKTQIAPTNKDWLVIEQIPSIFHTGHVHINDMDKYNNVCLINSGCFQSQTDYMKSFGIIPTPGIVPIVELDTLKGIPLDLKRFN